MILSSTAGRVLRARRVLQRRSRQSPFKSPQSTSHNPPPKQQPNSPNTSSADAKTIPGPLWLWTEPLNSYTRVHSRRPHTVQVISTLIIYFLGDLASQNIAPSPQNDDEEASKPSSYDPMRTVRALIIGGAAAIPGYHWFLFLARNFNYSSKTASIAIKVLINQIVFTPVFNSYFFGMQSALSGASLPEIVERVKNTVPRSWVNSWKVWPAITAFSFTFIRIELRGLFAGVIAIGWQTYLSVLNQRAAKMEQQIQTAERKGLGRQSEVAA